MCRILLVHIPSERQVRPVVDSAVLLAMTHAAHLQAVSIGYETSNGGPGHLAAQRSRRFLRWNRNTRAACANAALAVFEIEAL